MQCFSAICISTMPAACAMSPAAKSTCNATNWNRRAIGEDAGYFPDDFDGDHRWKIMQGEYDLMPGVRAISSPGHTAGHMSLFIELPKGPPVILCGDAADLTENLEDEVAPGLCWREQETMALDSIRKLKRLAREEGAQLWPNHDMAFWRSLRHFPLVPRMITALHPTQRRRGRRGRGGMQTRFGIYVRFA